MCKSFILKDLLAPDIAILNMAESEHPPRLCGQIRISALTTAGSGVLKSSRNWISAQVRHFNQTTKWTKIEQFRDLVEVGKYWLLWLLYPQEHNQIIKNFRKPVDYNHLDVKFNVLNSKFWLNLRQKLKKYVSFSKSWKNGTFYQNFDSFLVC